MPWGSKILNRLGEDGMADIFISYSSPDRTKAELLAQILVQKGRTVWWDRVIPPGKAFDEVIDDALDSAKCVIVLWSRSSVSSAWVKGESAEGARRKILIPVLIEAVRVPLEFRRLQAADLIAWDGAAEHAGLKTLLNAVVEIICKPGNANQSVNSSTSQKRKARPQKASFSEQLLQLIDHANNYFWSIRGRQDYDAGGYASYETAFSIGDSRSNSLWLEPDGKYSFHCYFAKEVNSSEAQEEFNKKLAEITSFLSSRWVTSLSEFPSRVRKEEFRAFNEQYDLGILMSLNISNANRCDVQFVLKKGGIPR
jgi:hypothetical protein